MSRLVYGIDDRPPLSQTLPLGVQHLVAMLLGNITPPLVIALALGLGSSDTTLLIQTALVMAGLATCVQSYPIGPVGARLPIVMGTSVVFMGTIIVIARQYNLATAFGACLAAAVVEVAMAMGIGRVQKVFPPLVSSIVVILIGLTLIPIGMDYAAGGQGAPDYGAPRHLGVAALVLVVSLLLNRFGRGLWHHGSILIGVTCGYGLAIATSQVDFSSIGAARWAALPRPYPFGLELHWGPILVMAVVYAVSAVETVGDLTAVVAPVGREPTRVELRGGLLADGVMSSIAAVFGGFPNTSYSQNAGLVSFTGVASRHVTAVSGVLLVILGLVPKVSAVFATLPPSVIGGAGLIMFAMIFSSGVVILHRQVELTQRNLVILAVAIALGLGVELRPDALSGLPDWGRTFAGSGLVVGALSAAVMNAVFPEDPAATRVSSARDGFVE